MVSFERGTLVVVTHNRRARLLRTLRILERLPEGWPVIVVDNGSTDGTAEAVRKEFPAVLLVCSRHNLGPAARNIAVAFVHTPYVAFCDDDTHWLPGSLSRATQIMDENPAIGIVSGCVLLSDSGRVDPACVALAGSPLEQEGLPGPQLLDFMLGASVVRTRAFYEANGFRPPFFAGGEALMALDLADKGWRIVYMDDVKLTRERVAPPKTRDAPIRDARNAIWIAWMRLPARLAWRETRAQLYAASQRHQLELVLAWSLSGLWRVMKERQVVTPRVAAMRARLMVQAWAKESTRRPPARGSLA